MDVDDYRITFLFFPSEDAAHGWGLDLERFARSLEEGFPEAHGNLRAPDSDRPYLSIWAETDDGVVYDGLASVVGRDTVVISGSTVREAARFATWLRAAVVPPGEGIWFSSEAAVSAGFDERYWHLPDEGGRPAAEEALRRHVAEVGTGGG